MPESSHSTFARRSRPAETNPAASSLAHAGFLDDLKMRDLSAPPRALGENILTRGINLLGPSWNDIANQARHRAKPESEGQS